MEYMTLNLEQIRFLFDHDTVGFRASGVLYIEIGGICFPDEQWYDLVSVDFEMWMPQLMSFGFGHSDCCLLQFMDGPCCIKLLRQSQGKVIATCLWNHKVEISEVEIDFLSFIKSVAACIKKMNRAIYEADREGKWGHIMERYGNFIKQIKEMVKRDTDCEPV